jgi:hypothetical protein
MLEWLRWDESKRMWKEITEVWLRYNPGNVSAKAEESNQSR